VLAYLDALCAALLARDAEEIDRLRRHPLARALPREVREEVLSIRRAGRRGNRAPIRTLRLYHQTAHVLGVAREPVRDTPQLELPLPTTGSAWGSA
jgi:hypothetical protein